MGENLVLLDGFLGRDAQCTEFGEKDNRRLVANLNLATSKVVNGERYTEWHRIVVFSKLGTKMSNALQELYKKGKQVAVKGELRTRAWKQDCSDCGKPQDRWSTEVHVTGFDGTRIRLLGSAPKQPEPPITESDIPPEVKASDADQQARPYDDPKLDNPISEKPAGSKKGKGK